MPRRPVKAATPFPHLPSRITVEGLERAPHRAFLRGLGLLLLWSLAGLQPTIAQVESEESTSRVLVAVDINEKHILSEGRASWPTLDLRTIDERGPIGRE